MDPSGRSERINRFGRRAFGTNYSDHDWITYEPLSGGSVALAGGVFRTSSVTVDPQTNTPVASNTPVLIVEKSQLPAGDHPAEGSHFSIRESGTTTRYVVTEQPQDEGEGTLRVFLRKA